MIATRYGGLCRAELELSLTKLIKLVQREQITLQICKPDPVANPDPSFQITFIPDRGFRAISQYEAVPIGSYNKAMHLIRSMDDGTPHSVTDIPEDLFKDFFNIAEMHPEIIFDEEQDYQYFSVNGFTKNR